MTEEVQERLGYQMRHTYYGAQPSIPGRHYFYVLGFTKLKNKKVFWGPMSQDDAYKSLGELSDGEIFELTTRDAHRAVREVRDILIKRGTSPDEALRRLLHNREDQKDEPNKPSLAGKLFRGRMKAKSATITKATRPPKVY